MAKRGYRQHLRSEKWAATRQRILDRDGHKCVRCPSTKFLHVHHKTYAHFGNEEDDDLETLCDVCHGNEHDTDFTKGRRAWKSHAAAHPKKKSKYERTLNYIATLPKEKRRAALLGPAAQGVMLTASERRRRGGRLSKKQRKAMGK